MPMDRRQFLRDSGLVLLTGWTAVGCTEPADEGNLANPAILPILGADHVRSIGRSYREAVPAERGAGALRRAIVEAREGADVERSTTGSSLDRSVREEFDRGRTVVVDGWILSVTEARQCALFSVLSA